MGIIVVLLLPFDIVRTLDKVLHFCRKDSLVQNVTLNDTFHEYSGVGLSLREFCQKFYVCSFFHVGTSFIKCFDWWFNHCFNPPIIMFIRHVACGFQKSVSLDLESPFLENLRRVSVGVILMWHKFGDHLWHLGRNYKNLWLETFWEHPLNFMNAWPITFQRPFVALELVLNAMSMT